LDQSMKIVTGAEINRASAASFDAATMYQTTY
jgi:hypothetical protein